MIESVTRHKRTNSASAKLFSDVVREKATAAASRRRSVLLTNAIDCKLESKFTIENANRQRSASHEDTTHEIRRRRISTHGRSLIQNHIPSKDLSHFNTQAENRPNPRPRAHTADSAPKNVYDPEPEPRGNDLDDSRKTHQSSQGTLNGYCAVVATFFRLNPTKQTVVGLELEQYIVSLGIARDWHDAARLCQRIVQLGFVQPCTIAQDGQLLLIDCIDAPHQHTAHSVYVCCFDKVNDIGEDFYTKQLAQLRRNIISYFPGVHNGNSLLSSQQLPLRSGDQVCFNGLGMSLRVIPNTQKLSFYFHGTTVQRHGDRFIIIRISSASNPGQHSPKGSKTYHSKPLQYGDLIYLLEASSNGKRGVGMKNSGELYLTQHSVNSGKFVLAQFVISSPGKVGAVLSGDHFNLFASTLRHQYPSIKYATKVNVGFTVVSSRYTTSYDAAATKLVPAADQRSPLCWTVHRAVPRNADFIARRRRRSCRNISVKSIWGAPQENSTPESKSSHTNQTTRNTIPRGISVMVYNVWMLPSVVTAFSQRLMGVSLRKNTRARLIPTALPSASCDIIVLCEAFCTSASDVLVEGLKRKGYLFESPICATTSSSHMLKALNGGVKVVSKYPISDTRVRLFGSISCGDDSLADKGIVYVKVTVGDAPVHVFATHTQAWDTPTAVQIREKQLFVLRHFIDQLRIPNSELVVIAGDLNVDRINAPDQYARMLQLLNATDLNSTIPELVGASQDLTPSFDANGNDLAKSGPSSGGTSGLLDFVLVSETHARPVTSAAMVIPLKSEIGYEWHGNLYNDLSDHYPVLAHMQW